MAYKKQETPNLNLPLGHPMFVLLCSAEVSKSTGIEHSLIRAQCSKAALQTSKQQIDLEG